MNLDRLRHMDISSLLRKVNMIEEELSIANYKENQNLIQVIVSILLLSVNWMVLFINNLHMVKICKMLYPD